MIQIWSNETPYRTLITKKRITECFTNLKPKKDKKHAFIVLVLGHEVCASIGEPALRNEKVQFKGQCLLALLKNLN